VEVPDVPHAELDEPIEHRWVQAPGAAAEPPQVIDWSEPVTLRRDLAIEPEVPRRMHVIRHLLMLGDADRWMCLRRCVQRVSNVGARSDDVEHLEVLWLEDIQRVLELPGVGLEPAKEHGAVVVESRQDSLTVFAEPVERSAPGALSPQQQEEIALAA